MQTFIDLKKKGEDQIQQLLVRKHFRINRSWQTRI